MAARAMRVPPARRRRWPSRLLGALATAALLGSGVAIVMMVMPSPEKEERAAPAPTPTPAAKRKHGLTKAQKAARRDAVGTLREQGYEPVRLADWRPGGELRVLIGRDDTGAMRAFFFVGRDFVGNDDPSTSGRLRVTNAGKRGVTLAYGLTTGGAEKVRFRWQDGALAPSTPVPPVTMR
jgi:hypothetical protein